MEVRSTLRLIISFRPSLVLVRVKSGGARQWISFIVFILVTKGYFYRFAGDEERDCLLLEREFTSFDYAFYPFN